MKNERDWLNYAKLASSFTQNLQLGEINSQLKEMRDEQRRGNYLIVFAEQVRQLEAERKKVLRNSLWHLMQALESARKDYTDNPLTMAFALRALTPELSADEFDEWEDKQRLKAFFNDLASLKDETKIKLGNSQFDDAMMCCSAFDELKDLNQFIITESKSGFPDVKLEKYRQTLLEAAMRCFKLDSLEEAEAKILDEPYRLQFLETLANAEKTAILKKELQANERIIDNEIYRLQWRLVWAVLLLCLFSWGAAVRIMKATGLMETTQERSEHIWPATFLIIVSSVLIFWIVYISISIRNNRRRSKR